MKSLRGQLTLRLLLGGALLLAVAGEALHWRLRAALMAEFDAALRASAESLFAFTEQSEGKVGEVSCHGMLCLMQTRGSLARLTRTRALCSDFSRVLRAMPLAPRI